MPASRPGRGSVTRMKAVRAVFGDSFIPELREILTSTATATFYSPDGRRQVTREQPFTYPWRPRWIGIAQDSGNSRVTCGLEADGKIVTATIDAADFGRMSRNTSRSRAWNESKYHDMAVQASTLIEEQILTWDPSMLDGEIQIRLPSDR
jgi:hypothetical protein